MEAARIADEHGNPVTPQGERSAGSEAARVGEAKPTGRDYVHVNVAYCIS